MGNIHVKLYEIWTSGSGDVVKKISYLDLWRLSCSVERNLHAIFKEGIMGNIHVKLYEIWTNGSGGDVV